MDTNMIEHVFGHPTQLLDDKIAEQISNLAILCSKKRRLSSDQQQHRIQDAGTPQSLQKHWHHGLRWPRKNCELPGWDFKHLWCLLTSFTSINSISKSEQSSSFWKISTLDIVSAT
jgi:hypothetical protein